MLRIAHLVHPVVVAPSSDLLLAQPVTFETMRCARECAVGVARVQLCAVQYADEERLPLPDCFYRTRDLQRCVADIGSFQCRRKLALIADILGSFNDVLEDADYLIYSNVDIGLQPHFYATVAALVSRGSNSFAINRRTVSSDYRSVADLPLIWAELGTPHPGWDCFVFPASFITAFRVGLVCLGAGGVGRTMIANLARLDRHFHVFEDLHATFHLGNDRIWKEERYRDYSLHNHRECLRVLESFEAEDGPFSSGGWLDRTARHVRSVVEAETK